MEILKIEKGWVDDDFVQFRITLKVYTNDPDHYYLCKLYDDGRVVTFSSQYNPYSYEEKDLSPAHQEAIRRHLEKQ